MHGPLGSEPVTACVSIVTSNLRAVPASISNAWMKPIYIILLAHHLVGCPTLGAAFFFAPATEATGA